jgi:hypothetical protein
LGIGKDNVMTSGVMVIPDGHHYGLSGIQQPNRYSVEIKFGHFSSLIVYPIKIRHIIYRRTARTFMNRRSTALARVLEQLQA